MGLFLFGFPAWLAGCETPQYIVSALFRVATYFNPGIGRIYG